MSVIVYVHVDGVLKTRSRDSCSPDYVVLTYEPQQLTPEQELHSVMIFRQSNRWNSALYCKGNDATYSTAVTMLIVLSKKIFTIQKRIIRIMVGAHPRTSWRRLFKKLEILTVPNQHIYSLMSFFFGNQEKFQTNSSVHNINTRNKHHLHRPVANLSCFQKGASYSGIKIFNSLPRSITNLKNENTQFKLALKSF
jgi:hypothetical protein